MIEGRDREHSQNVHQERHDDRDRAPAHENDQQRRQLQKQEGRRGQPVDRLALATDRVRPTVRRGQLGCGTLSPIRRRRFGAIRVRFHDRPGRLHVRRMRSLAFRLVHEVPSPDRSLGSCRGLRLGVRPISPMDGFRLAVGFGCAVKTPRHGPPRSKPTVPASNRAGCAFR